MAPGDMPLVAGFAFAVMSSLPRSVIVALLSVGFVLVAAKVVGAFRAKEAPFWLRTAKPIKTPLEDDDTVALLVASRAPRETHGALAAVSRRLARVVSSPALAKERVGAGWLEGPRKMHRVSVRRLRSGRYRPAKHIDHDDPSPGYLFERDVRRCTLVLCQLVVSRRGADPDPRTALWDTFVELVDLFHGHHLVMRRMAIAPSHGDYLVGYSNFGEPRNGLGAGFSDHLVHHAIVIDYAVRHYTRADVEDKDALSLSWYGKRLCDLGLLCEYYDEKAQKWSIDADGWMIRDLLSIWGRHGGPDGPGRPCPVDAPMAIVFAYVAVMTAPNVKEHMKDRDIMIGGYMDFALTLSFVKGTLDDKIKELAEGEYYFVDGLRDPSRRRMYGDRATANSQLGLLRADAERQEEAARAETRERKERKEREEREREEREREERREAQRKLLAEREQDLAQFQQSMSMMMEMSRNHGQQFEIRELGVEPDPETVAAIEEALAARENRGARFGPMGAIEDLSSDDEPEDPAANAAWREMMAEPDRLREHFTGEDLPGDEELE